MLRYNNELGNCHNESRFNPDFIVRLRELAIQGLQRMYMPDKKLFIFRLKKAHGNIESEGLSPRYTAISLIGLAGVNEDSIEYVLSGQKTSFICDQLKKDIGHLNNLGDIGLLLWATSAIDYPDRQIIRERLLKLKPETNPYPTVELSWVLDALCLDNESFYSNLAKAIAGRLITSFNPKTGMFPHYIGKSVYAPRSFVACFADLVYPIHALATYYKKTDDMLAFEIAVQCAEKICRLQGPNGQWWWHYDIRTGNIIEPYPVYAVHQDAMAPMALLAIHEIGGPNFAVPIQKGLDWLSFSPEINASLVDDKANLIWRKVARKEPGKLSRYAQTIACRIHRDLRLPILDKIFVPTAIDHESRPYHLGWVLYAWADEFLAQKISHES